MLTEHPTRLRLARWFRPLLSAGDLAVTLEARSRALDAAHDGRAPACKVRASQAHLLVALIERGTFGPATAWIEHLELTRGSRYMRALEDWDRGETALLSAPWCAAFSLQRHAGVDPAAAVALSEAIHTSYDLPLALARIGDPDAGQDALAPYAALGEAYAASIESAQQDVVRASPARGASPATERMTAAAFRVRWANAWLDAQHLLDATDDGRREAAFLRIETAALREVRTLATAT